MCVAHMLKHMKRPALVLDDDLFRQIKQEAAGQGESLKTCGGGLRRMPLPRKPSAKPFKLNWKPKKGILRPDVNYADRNELYEILDGRR